MPPLFSPPTPWPWWMALDTWNLSETREWNGRLWGVSYFASGWQHWFLGFGICHLHLCISHKSFFVLSNWFIDMVIPQSMYGGAKPYIN